MNGVPRRPGSGRVAGLSRRAAGLTWRGDLALPAAAGAVQLAGSYLITGRLRYHTGHPARAGGMHLGLLLPPGGHLTALDWLLLAVGPAALIVRRRHPVAVAWLALTAALAPSPLWFGYLSLAVACFAAATSGHRPAAWAVLAAGYAGALWLAPLAWGRPVAPAGAALFAAAWLAVLVAAAEVARMRRERRSQASAARELAARHRADEERLRMARELHDVVGHNMSLINIQAGVGLDLMDADPGQARAALTAVRAVSSQALGELRAMLSALREAGEQAPRSPAPGLGRLPELIARTSAAGVSVTAHVTGQARPLPAAVDLAAYRIVQESLTNAARHARAASVTVQVAYGEDDLRIDVADDGRGVPAGRAGSGTGIHGMRERAVALGGQFEAGPRPGRGFGVRARLPLGGAP
jgi:signal transduction histidine kinase